MVATTRSVSCSPAKSVSKSSPQVRLVVFVGHMVTDSKQRSMDMVLVQGVHKRANNRRDAFRKTKIRALDVSEASDIVRCAHAAMHVYIALFHGAVHVDHYCRPPRNNQ